MSVGKEHKHSDFYSTENPIPNIQRFVKKGLSTLVAKRAAGGSSEESESDEDDEDEDDRQLPDGGTAGEASSSGSLRSGGKLSKVLHPNRERRMRQQDEASSQRSKTDDRDTGHDDEDEDEEAKEEEEKAPEERAQEKASGKYRKQKRGKATNVYDPITEQEIKVRDVRKRDYRTAMDREEARRHGRDMYSEDSQRPVNLAKGVFPPEQPLPELRDVHPWLLPLWLTWSLSFIIWSRSSTAIAFALVNAWLGWWAFRHIKLGVDEKRWERESARGKSANIASLNSYDQSTKGQTGGVAGSQSNMEGAEWLNSMLQSMWEVIDPALFEAAAGTLEDVMQASAPSFIHMIKVADLAHGLTPLRVAGVKAEYVNPSKDGDGGGSGDDGGEADDAGKVINLQMSVVYSAARTGAAMTTRSRNARLVIYFYLGLRKFVSIPLPVWVEIKGFVGTVRARLQLSPEAPFIKNVTVTFLGLPRVRVEVVPLKVNLADIPLLSGFVQSSIDAALAEYCAPSSLTLDVGEILMGDNIKREVNALGVLAVWIHRAYDLEKQDRRGSSDPYVTVSYSRLGKVLYATRVALNDLNPRWEECHILLVTAEAVRAKEKISLALYDSDLLTADDILGRVEFDIAPLIRRPGHRFHRSDALMGLRNDHTKKGQVETTVAFYKKSSNRVERQRMEQGKKHGQDATKERGNDMQMKGSNSSSTSDGESAVANAGKKASSSPEGHKDSNGDGDPFENLDEKTSTRDLLKMLDAAESSRQTRNQQSSVQFSPPHPDVPSGILSIQVHNIEDLGFRNAGAQKGKSNARGGQAGSAAQQVDDVEDEQEESADTPSSYVSIILNDATIMRSRVKALTRNPFFNVGTERFLRDWRRAYVMVVVRDRRLREEDALLGVVPIKLSTLFSEHGTSQVTQHFPLAGGLGYGRVRISVLFRPVEGMQLDKSKLGFDIGTMRVHSSPRAIELKDPSLLKLCSLRMRTLAGQVKLTSRHQRTVDNGDLEWRVKPEDLWLRVPARRRYSAPFLLEFRRPNAVGKKSLVAASIIWLQDVEDDARWEARLPIYKGDPDLHRFLQNYHDWRNESEACSLGVTRVGTLVVDLQFKSGIGLAHARLDTNPDSRAVMQAWEACVAAGLRSENGDFVRDNEEDSEVVGDEARESQATEESEGESDDEDGTRTTAQRNSPQGHDADRQGQDVDSDDIDDSRDSEDIDSRCKGADPASKAPLSSRLREWRAEWRELDRQHRGLRAHKTVRSLDWAAGGVKRAGSKMKQGLSVQDRAAQPIDSEL